MPNSISNYCPTAAFTFLTSTLTSALRGALLCPLYLLSISLPASADDTIGLKSYSAVYTSSLSGLSVDMQQTLKPLGDNLWQLNNNASLFFTGFEETAIFKVDGNAVKPQSYEYNNKLSKRRSSQLFFNWKEHSYIDKLHSTKPGALDGPAWDKLSFQAQLRLELLNHNGKFEEKIYPEIDRTKIKHYVVTKLGEEVLHTELGNFTTVKLQEQRQGRDDHTLIWAAKDWDYLILRLQRVEEGKVEYEINLKEAKLEGREVRGDAQGQTRQE